MSNFNPNRIIIWGLKRKYHTHRHIHQAFFKNAKKLGYKTLWLEDEGKNAKLIEAGDLIISSGPVGKMVPEKFVLDDYNLPIRDDVFYCLHAIKDVFKDKLNPDRFINLCVYVNSVPKIEGIIKIGPVTYFDPKTRSLYQPWGTDLLAEEFKKPVFNSNKFVFWIGSVWNNALNQGNIEEIKSLKEVLKFNKLKFIKLRFIPDALNTFFIRKSRIAPGIAGRWQVENDYLPCRVFKNISYGQLGITNVKEFKNILGDSFLPGDSITELINNSLALSREEYLAKVKAQQEIIKNYTYKNALENIIRAFNI